MRKVLIALAAFVVVLTAAALPSSAGSIPMDYVVTIAPTSGQTGAGTVVTFTPTDLCPVNNGGTTNAPGDVIAAVSLIPDPTVPADFLADTGTDGSGDWSLDYTIPVSEPVGDITFYAFCIYEQFPTVEVAPAAVPDDFSIWAEYLPVTFSVTAPTTSTTTSTTSSTSTTSTTAAPATPTLVATPTTVFPGDTIAVNASGFKPGSSVVITLESDPVNLGSFVADSAGRVVANVTVPTGFAVGSHTLKVTGTDIAGSVLVLSTGITVASRIQAVTSTAPAAATTSTLPRTGSSITEPALLVGAGLVVVGAVALVAARRRSSSR